VAYHLTNEDLIRYLIMDYNTDPKSNNVLHSSNEPSELSQWPCGHDDSTINIVLVIMPRP